MRMLGLLCSPGRRDTAARGWLRGRGGSQALDCPALGLRFRGDRPTLLVGPGDPDGAAVLARAALDRGGVRVFLLHPLEVLAPFDRLAFRVVFQQGSDAGNGLLTLRRTVGPLEDHHPGRWWEARFEEGRPNGVTARIDAFADGERLLVDPPLVEVDEEAVEGLDGAGGIPGSTSCLLPPVRVEQEASDQQAPGLRRARAALRQALAAGWAERPIALDAMALSDAPALRDLLREGGSVALLGGDREGAAPVDVGRLVSPSRLAVLCPEASECRPVASMRARVLAGEGEGLAAAVGRALRGDLDRLLAEHGAELRCVEAQGTGMQLGARSAKHWTTPGTWAALAILRSDALDAEQQATFDAHVLEPMRNREHRGAASFDNAGAELAFLDRYGLAAAPLSAAWLRSFLFLLDARGGGARSPEWMAEVYRGGGTSPDIRRFPREPLMLVYGRASSLRRETWRWLLPRGSVIRSWTNRLDDDLSPLGTLRLE